VLFLKNKQFFTPLKRGFIVKLQARDQRFIFDELVKNMVFNKVKL